MPLSMDALADDLAAETAELRATLRAMTGADWRRPTPARGWCIGDQVSHPAHFDDVAVQAVTDSDGFLAELARWNAEGGVNPDTICARFRDMPGEDAALAITGCAAGEWMAIAQAFAGPPGAGRQRGQFR